MPKGGVQEVDKRIGKNIRRYRIEKNLSQTELAERLDLTFQQVQKYEKGTNRVSAGRLQLIAGFLGCTIHDLLGTIMEGESRTPDVLRDLGQTRVGLELARAFKYIDSLDKRQTLLQVAYAFAGDSLRRDRAPQSAVGSDSHPQAQTHAPNAERPNLRGAGRARPAS